VAVRERRRLGAVADAELGEDMVHMAVDGVPAADEGVRDVGVAVARRDQTEDFQFARSTARAQIPARLDPHSCAPLVGARLLAIQPA
jgi:hypothetical protein